MGLIEKVKVTSGIYWIGIPDAGLNVLCGSPGDSVKHLMKLGLVKEVEINDAVTQTGPNAILLSELMVQNGHFANLTEFPVLQMLYKQGMLIPGHPNNTGEKPMIIGTRKQLHANTEYIYRGTYGLVSMDEMMQAGASPELAKIIYRTKLKFTYGNIRATEELLNIVEIQNDPIHLKNEVYLERIGFNRYLFKYKGEEVSVDLNLAPNEVYEAPYELEFHRIDRKYFSVIHSGEGDGWDMNRPCMSSIISFQGKFFIIDAGPNILSPLTALGISINDIHGVFLTHAHDDHFAGLTTLMKADHKIKFYATPLVQATVQKKLNSLLSSNRDVLQEYFDVKDLAFDAWNNINGLEVRPTLSPHPLETSIFTFRALWDGGYRTYGHYADIASFQVLEDMVTEDPEAPGMSREYADRVKKRYLTPVNLKKVDVGGGSIHGNAEDFREDISHKIILSHTTARLKDADKEIGSRAPFGMVDVLIPGDQQYVKQYAFRYLASFFPEVPLSELNMLLNCPVISFNPGTIIMKAGEEPRYIYLIIDGLVEMIQSQARVRATIAGGTPIGDLALMKKAKSRFTYASVSYVSALRMPTNLYIEFMRRNSLDDYLTLNRVNGEFLQSTFLFGEMLSYPTLFRISRSMEKFILEEGKEFKPENRKGLYLLENGMLELTYDEDNFEMLYRGDFCGEDSLFFDSHSSFSARVLEMSSIFFIPDYIISEIPIVRWKLLEKIEKRKKFKGSISREISTVVP